MFWRTDIVMISEKDSGYTPHPPSPPGTGRPPYLPVGPDFQPSRNCKKEVHIFPPTLIFILHRWTCWWHLCYFTHHQFLLHSWCWWLLVGVCVSVPAQSWLLFILLLSDPVLRLLILCLIKLIFSLVVGVVLRVQLIYDSLQRESPKDSGDGCVCVRASPVDMVGVSAPPSFLPPPLPHSAGVCLCLITCDTSNHQGFCYMSADGLYCNSCPVNKVEPNGLLTSHLHHRCDDLLLEHQCPYSHTPSSSCYQHQKTDFEWIWKSWPYNNSDHLNPWSRRRPLLLLSVGVCVLLLLLQPLLPLSL